MCPRKFRVAALRLLRVATAFPSGAKRHCFGGNSKTCCCPRNVNATYSCEPRRLPSLQYTMRVLSGSREPGQLNTPTGTVQPNGEKVDVPTADFWYVRDGKIERFDCYVMFNTMFAQMGVR